MDPRRNPYAPGAGRPPEALVGRDAQLEGWEIALSRLSAGRTVQPVVLYGLRGVGKTVLLTEFARLGNLDGWIVASVEAGSGDPLRSLLGEALYEPLVDLARPDLGARMRKALKTALSFKLSYDPDGVWSFGIDLDGITGGGGANTGAIEPDLRRVLLDLATAAAEEGTGLAVLIDEAQDLSTDELVAVCSVAHRAGQLGLPLMIALAGLPDLRRRLAEAKSYAERLFTYQSIQQLPRELAQDALTRPAAMEGVTWAADAVDRVVHTADGYPYFLQQFGQDTWDYAHGDHTLTLHDAEVGIARGQAHLDDGFYRTRWDRATKSEKRYLRAMAADGDHGSNTGEVAARLGIKPTSLGPTRANLINKGLLFAPDHGIIRFTVPAMAAFITRQVD